LTSSRQRSWVATSPTGHLTLDAGQDSTTMRLLHVSTRDLHEFSSDPPRYAILSHTWGKEEVTFEDLRKPNHTSKLGYKKIDGCCKQAQLGGFEWVWIDTCCIDKSSSAELSETINSMFAWYERSSICYIYLEDVPSAHPHDHKAQGSAFRSSRWFTRGWTLQELLASKRRQIFDSSWQRIDFHSHEGAIPYYLEQSEADLLSEITGIPSLCLWDDDASNFRTALSTLSVSVRMSWASRRTTTRVEDMAYCLLGIFEVNMPLLYGEGSRAFIRLQEEIIRKTPDETIFCWDYGHSQEDSNGKPTSALALSPAEFIKGGELYESSTKFKDVVHQRYEAAERLAFHTTLTNQGILIELPLHFIDELNGLALAVLNVYTGPDHRRVALPVVRANRLYSNIFTKAPGCTLFVLPKDYSPPPSNARIYLQHGDKKRWEISSELGRDHPLNYNLQLRGDAWRVDGWHLNGWYPPIPFDIDYFPQQFHVSSITSLLPSRVLFTFGNRICSLLCYLVTTKTEQSFDLKLVLSIIMTPALTPLDVLYCVDSRRVEFSQLERFEWIIPAKDDLSCGARKVRAMINHLPGPHGYNSFVGVELSMT
jgi:hypothetical protein